MVQFPVVFAEGPATVPVLAQLFVAVILSWVSIELYRGMRNPRMRVGDALLLDLGLGLTTVTAVVFWFSVSLRILF